MAAVVVDGRVVGARLRMGELRGCSHLGASRLQHEQAGKCSGDRKGDRADDEFRSPAQVHYDGALAKESPNMAPLVRPIDRSWR